MVVQELLVTDFSRRSFQQCCDTQAGLRPTLSLCCRAMAKPARGLQFAGGAPAHVSRHESAPDLLDFGFLPLLNCSPMCLLIAVPTLIRCGSELWNLSPPYNSIHAFDGSSMGYFNAFLSNVPFFCPPVATDR